MCYSTVVSVLICSLSDMSSDPPRHRCCNGRAARRQLACRGAVGGGGGEIFSVCDPHEVDMNGGRLEAERVP